MRPTDQITIKDVARLAGVSPGTVSNALSGKRPVSEITRQRILDAIDELDYHPNLLARSLVSRQSATLAVVASGLDYYGPTRTLVGVEERANDHGYSLLLSLVHDPNDIEVEPVLRDLTARRVDGIIWAIPEIGDNRAWLDEEMIRSLPPVVFLTMNVRPGVSIVNTDNCAGGRMATEHLLAQGLRRIGLIMGPSSWWEARERRRGWELAMAAHDVTEIEQLVVEGDWQASSGEAAVAELLRREPALEGVFVCNDQMAVGALRAIHALGLRAPQDLAIVGYDNVPEAAYYWPALTSVRQHLTDVGHAAVDELHARIEQRQGDEPGSHTTHQVLMPELIIRESSRLMGGED